MSYNYKNSWFFAQILGLHYTSGTQIPQIEGHLWRTSNESKGRKTEEQTRVGGAGLGQRDIISAHVALQL